MLGKFLDEHPLINLLKGTVDCPFPSIEARDAWEALPEQQKAEVVKLAEKYRDTPYPVLTASAFMAFVRDGSRKAYENPYFFRRRKLMSAFMACCVTGEDDYLDDVVDGIWCICEESSWVISAHNGSSHEGMRPAKERPLPDVQNPYIDLFSAQTAMILSFVCNMMEKKLDAVTPLIRRRVRLEIENRIIVPFMTRDDYWWMGFIRKDLCNWTPWIVSNVMMTAAIWVKDSIRLAELLDRACRMLDRYLAVLPEDGGCDEGAGYWNMAGGALLDCLDLLEYVTDGKMVFWGDKKLQAILSFPAKVRLENGWFVNFADCDARPFVSGERLQFAGERMHDAQLTAFGSAMRRELAYQITDTPQLWRMLNELFHPMLNMEAPEKQERDIWFPNLQVRILEKNGVILAAKGGHNAESHNHNDVGALALYIDGEPAVVDAGNMIYTAKTFSDARYTLWNTRSMYHNVPMIGGCEQLAGLEYTAEQVMCLPNGLQLDMAKAYDRSAGVERCFRTMCLDENGNLRVQDDIACESAQSVTWVWMLRHAPDVQEGKALAGNVEIVIPVGMTVQTEEIKITDARMAANYPGSLWRLTCEAAPAQQQCVTFELRRK